MKHVELIIFDLDGTLVDSKEAIARGVNFVLKKVGLQEKPKAEIISYIGTWLDNLIKKSLGPKQQALFEKAKFIFENYRQASPDSSLLYPGVKDILEHFKNKKKIIVTNRNYKFTLPTLKKLGIYDYFEDIIGGDDLTCLKPSGCPLDMAINRRKIDKDKIIIVGDMDIDILAGKEAGIATCAVTYGIGKKEDILKASPDFIIDKISELKNIIN